MNPAPSTAGRLLDIGFHTETGHVRDHNEDSLRVVTELGLFAVADGMGGHNAGERASYLAVHELQEHLGAEGGSEAPALARAFRGANTEIFRESLARPERRGMGTTMTALVIRGDQFWIGHVGDSRAWRLRDGACTQLTEDHSLVAEQMRQGMLTPEQALRHPMRNVLTRSLGNTAEVRVDLMEGRVRPGDVFVLGTDGMTKVLDAPLIGKRIAGVTSAAAAAQDLVAYACAKDGTDNVTVVVVGC